MGGGTGFGLDAVVLSGLRDALARYPEIRQACIFGSRARGDYGPGSDIDVALSADVRVPSELRHELDLAARIFKIDVVDLAELAEGPMRERIRAEGVVFYRKETIPQGC